jgi:CBS domain-containing protein
VGIGGLIRPRALGVGYDIISQLLSGELVGGILLGLLLVKAIIWMLSLGSGTSGGVLAPLLIIGGSLGALEAPFLPGSHALWPLISMAAILGGTMRSPLTGILFALELTHDVNALLPLVIACVIGHAFTVLMMPRSILTEKVARRGYHLSREYTVDPLEALTIDSVMSREVVTVPASMSAEELEDRYFATDSGRIHQGYPVLDADGKLMGVVTRSNLIANLEDMDHRTTGQLVSTPPCVAYVHETCRQVAERMASEGVGHLPVVRADDPKRVIGIVTPSDLLKARALQVEQERRRERMIVAPWEKNGTTATSTR